MWISCASDAPDYKDTHSFFGLVTKQICSPMNATDSARAVTKLQILNSTKCTQSCVYHFNQIKLN